MATYLNHKKISRFVVHQKSAVETMGTAKVKAAERDFTTRNGFRPNPAQLNAFILKQQGEIRPRA